MQDDVFLSDFLNKNRLLMKICLNIAFHNIYKYILVFRFLRIMSAFLLDFLNKNQMLMKKQRNTSSHSIHSKNLP